MRVKLLGLDPNQNYVAQFRANDGEAVSQWSRKYAFRTVGKPNNPGPIQNITWTTHGTSWVAKWDELLVNNDGSPIKDLDHYQVWIDDGFDSVKYNVELNTRFDFTIEMNRAVFGNPPTSVPSSPLTLRVRAKDKQGHPDDLGDGWSLPITTGNPAPEAPGNLTALVTGPNVLLKWSKVDEPDVVAYRVYQGVTPVYTLDSAHRIFEGDARSFSAFIDYGVTRHFYVTAMDVFGTESGGTYINATTEGLDTSPSDGFPPAQPAAPSVTSGIGTLFVRWAPVLQDEAPQYQVHVAPESAGPLFAPTSSTLVVTALGTSATIKTLGDDTPLEYSTIQDPVIYYVRIVAVDSDGTSPPSDAAIGEAIQVTGPDIAVDTILANNIVAGTLTGDLFSGTVVLGSTISTGYYDPITGVLSGPRVDLSVKGITVRGPNEQLISNFPTGVGAADPSAPVSATFNGIVNAESLTIVSDTTMGTSTDFPAGSIVTLRQGVTKPAAKPTMSATWDVTDSKFIEQPRGFAYGHDGLFWSVASVPVTSAQWLWKLMRSDGTVAAQANTTLYPLGIARPPTGTLYYILAKNTTDDYYIVQYNATSNTFSTAVRVLDGLDNDGVYTDPVIGCETVSTVRGQIILAHRNSNNRLRISHYNWTGSAMSTTYSSSTNANYSDTRPKSIHFGTFDLANTANNYVIGLADGRYHVMSNATTPVADANRTWPSRNNMNMVGSAWNGTNFYDVDGSGLITKYEGAPNYWVGGLTEYWWGTYTWADAAANFETGQSPAAKFSQTKRARLLMEVANLPSYTGVNTARYYLHKGVAADTTPYNGTWAQGTSASGSLLIATPSFTTGIHPGTLSAFPASTPSQLLSETGGFILRANGTGTWPAFNGTLGGTVKIGTLSRQITGIDYGSANGTTNGSGEFNIAHDLGVAPTMVVATNSGAGGNANTYVITAKSTSNFTVRVMNSAGDAIGSGFSRDIDWIALKN